MMRAETLSQKQLLWNSAITLRLIAMLLSALFVPAFLFGFVSLWALAFGVSLALVFSKNVTWINQDIDAKKPTRFWKHYALLYLSMAEGTFYVLISWLSFWFYFSDSGAEWTILSSIGLDAEIGFMDLFSFISFSDIASPYLRPDLFILSTANILALFIFISLLALAGKQMWKFFYRTLTFLKRYDFITKDYLLHRLILAGLIIASIPIYAFSAALVHAPKRALSSYPKIIEFDYEVILSVVFLMMGAFFLSLVTVYYFILIFSENSTTNMGAIND